jgi:uridine kinase
MIEYVNVSIAGNQAIKVKKGTRLSELVEKYASDNEYPVLLSKVNNQLSELSKEIKEDSSIEFLDIKDANGYRTYQRSVALLMIFAAKEILGKKTRVVVEHSINKNHYCEFPELEEEITDELLKKIEDRMKKAVEENMVIEKLSLSIEEGAAIAEEMGLHDKAHILQYRRTSNVNFYRIGWFYDYFYGQMAVNTGCLNKFKLVKELNGFLIVFPNPQCPEEFNEFTNREKISKVFIESSKWGKILKVDTVGALNDIICNDGLKDIIRISEGLHEKKIASFADMIYENHKKIVLIAGPSSSGKTTFANRLSVQLKVSGLNPRVISLDDYYLNRDEAPLDEFGKPDFEALESIDVNAFNGDIERLVEGKEISLPTFNFATGLREYKGNYLKLSDNDILVIEGIHGLNDKIASTVSEEWKFRIFISALTQLNIDDHNRIPTSDTRLIRRIVRDHFHRGFSALTTIDMWPSVVRGEGRHIFPYQEKADAMFNSALVYEMCVLKQYAEPLLFKIDKKMPQYTEARRILKFLDSFLGVGSENIPPNSILREFVGGSAFEK